ncbi:hypothetical protein ACW95P_03555 [Candidatus Mycoplasma pogonae]
MISEKSFEEVVANLEKYKLKKTKLSQINLKDIYLNLSYLSSEYCSLKNERQKLVSFTTESPASEFCIKNLTPDFLGCAYIDTYIMNTPFEKYMKDENLKNFDNDFDLYILENEHFGYDSKKVEFSKESKMQFLKYPFFDINYLSGFKQTFILVKTTPTNSKAEFYFKTSKYCDFMYGFSPKTNNFKKNICFVIKEIFGSKKNDCQPMGSDVIKREKRIDAETTFSKFIKKNKLKEVDYQYVLQNFTNFSPELIDFKVKSFNKIKNNKKTILKENASWIDYLYLMNEIFINFSEKEKFGKAIRQSYSFWNEEDLPYLKFYILDTNFLNVKNLRIKTRIFKTENLYKMEFDDSYSLEKYAFAENIIFNKNITWPILVWDQKNFQKPFYKIISPFSISTFYNIENSKIFFERFLEKVRKMNKFFASYWD